MVNEMLPETIPHYSIGPFFGFTANTVVLILCLITFLIYSSYRPLLRLLFFYLFLSLFFLGWFIQGLQISTESIVWGYRINLSALALLPATWVFFMLALSDKKPGLIPWVVTIICIILSTSALLGKGSLFIGLPLESHPSIHGIVRPQSRLLKPLIYGFCLVFCFYYFLFTSLRYWALRKQGATYLLYFSLGLFFWLLGGAHDALLSFGISFITREKILFFTSFGLSVFLGIAIVLHFRSLEQGIREELERLNRAKGKALHHLSHELRTPLAIIRGRAHILKRKLSASSIPPKLEGNFEALERNLERLFDIQYEAGDIIRSYKNAGEKPVHD